MRKAFILVFAVILAGTTTVRAAEPETKATPAALSKHELIDFQTRLSAAMTKHLDMLCDPKAKVSALKGKSAEGMSALAFYLMFEVTGKQEYRAAAVELADRILKDTKATKHGVLYIKEKENDSGETIGGGGPPALGWYATGAAYVFHKEGGRNDDLTYIATVIDRFPWNEEGWWAATIDIKTGQPKLPLTKPSPINKDATMAMTAAIVSAYVKRIDPDLSARLKGKADKCIYKKIIPAQEADGFWHYNLNGNDPKNKDILGYFMLTTHALLQMQQFTDSYRDPTIQATLDKACAFSLKHIAPMTEPNKGPAAPANRRTAGTPAQYRLAEDTKRGYELGFILFGSKNHAEGVKIMDCAMKHFPHGNGGMDGAHAALPSALMLVLLKQELGK